MKVSNLRTKISAEISTLSLASKSYLKRTLGITKSSESIPKIHFITYGDTAFSKSRERICKEAKKLYLFDSIHAYTELDRERWFVSAPEATRRVLEQNRGGGYWIWKPFCVSERLSEIGEHDVLLYADSGCQININQTTIDNLIKLVQDTVNHESGILRFENRFYERAWTKRDVYNRIYPEAFHRTREHQLSANRFIMVNKDSATAHIEEWKSYVWEDPSLFDDSPSRTENAPEFKENRHDQSVFSLISKRRGCFIKKLADIEPSIRLARIRA
jgi:hypothetical protein